MPIKSALESVFNDLTNLETAVFKSAENNDEKTPLSYTQIQLEGDTINWVNGNIQHKEEIMTLHKSMVQTSQKGRLAMLRFAGSVLDALT